MANLAFVQGQLDNVSMPYSTDFVLYISMYICSERQHVTLFFVAG